MVFRRILPLAVCFQLSLSLIAVSSEKVAIDGELQQWHRVSLTFDGPESSEDAKVNPFRDCRMTVAFMHAKTGKRYIVPGFFAADGNAAETSATMGNKWRVRFTPDETGTWNYIASFRTGKDVAISGVVDAGKPLAFDGAAGVIEVGATDKTGRDFRGKGMLRYVGEHYLQFAGDKSWFLKGGADSPENFLAYADFDDTWSAKQNKNGKHGEALLKGLHVYAPHGKDWREGDPTWKDAKGKGIIGALNYLSSQGMNSVYFLTMNITGDGDDVWPYADRDKRDRFDCSKLDQWEIVFSHMDQLGIQLHVITQETENDQLLDGGALGDERKLYYRELIARFAHHPAVVWNLGEENTNTDAQRKQFCEYIRTLDAYHHPIVCHTFPGKYDEVYRPLLGEANFEGPSLQTNDTHNQSLRWRVLSNKAGRKWVVNLDEIGKADTGVKPDKDDPNHDEVRRNHLWGNLMAGGAGVEWYFGYKFAHNDLNCEDFRSRANMWKQTRIALEFFQTHLPFHQMVPADGLTADGDDYVFAQGGAVYAVYLPHGGATAIELPDARYNVRWFNSRAGGELQTGSKEVVAGPGSKDIGSPPGDKSSDWVALVTYEHLGKGQPPQVDIPEPRIDAPQSVRNDNSNVNASDVVVTGFTLINADSNAAVKGFENISGEVTVELSKLPSRNLNLVANTKSTAISVRFALNDEDNYQNEGVAPYALEGDTNGNFNGRQFKPETYTITATPLGQVKGRRVTGEAAKLTLTVRP